jgi:uncharacterized repeat protein (TIGR01451 family)
MATIKLRRPIVAATTFAVVGLTSIVGWQQQASAATVVGGFEIDGNIAAAADTDWSNAPATEPIAKDGVGNPDNTIYFGGSKEDTPADWQVHSSGQATGKDDIGYVFAYAHRVSGHEYAYFAFERSASNGTTQYFQELNQKPDTTNSHGVLIPDRSEGDLRLLVTQQGNGSFTISASIDRYTNGAYETLAPPAGTVHGQSNAAAIDPIDNQDPLVGQDGKIAAGKFAEVAFDLTGLASAAETCRPGAFTTLNGRSQTATANGPELKDFIAPISVAIPPDCATLHITKTGPNGTTAAKGARFTISPDPSTGTGGPITVTDGGTATAPNDIADPDGTANGVIDITGVEPGTDYTVTEVAPPPGYFLGSTTEITHSTTNGQTVNYHFSDPLGSVTFGKVNDASPAQPLCCAHFTVQATSGPAKDAGVKVTVVDNGSNDADAAQGSIKVNNLRIGHYTITETVPPAGYSSSTAAKSFQIGPDIDAKDAVVSEPFVDSPLPQSAGSMGLVKSVDPTGTAQYGDTLTYSLVATANGTLDEHNVVVSDVVPDDTTYVDGSAACVGTPCTPSYDAATQTVSWALGDMAQTTSRTVSFAVTINTPAAGDPAIASVTNVGAVASDEDPSTPSNEVVTTITQVLGTHVVANPSTLPFTGQPLGRVALEAIALIFCGIVMTWAYSVPTQARYRRRH